MEIGIIGLGTQGVLHAEILDRMGQSVTGVDVSADRRERFERQFGSVTYECPADMFDDGVDAVCVTTPNKFRETAATTAFERGYDVFIEKPLAHSVESAKTIASAARSAEGFCMVGYPDVFFDSIRYLRDRIASGYFGDVSHVEARYVRQRGIPRRGSWFTNKDLAGGGALLDLGSNVLAVAAHLLEDPEYVEVMGVTRKEFGHRRDYRPIDYDNVNRSFTVEDSATALLCTDDGRSVSIEVAWATNSATKHEYHVRGTDAGATLDLTDASHVADVTPDGDERLTLYSDETDESGRPVDLDPGSSYNNQFETFLDAVRSGVPPELNTIDDALAVQRTVADVYDASVERDTRPVQ